MAFQAVLEACAVRAAEHIFKRKRANSGHISYVVLLRADPRLRRLRYLLVGRYSLCSTMKFEERYLGICEWGQTDLRYCFLDKERLTRVPETGLRRILVLQLLLLIETAPSSHYS